MDSTDNELPFLKLWREQEAVAASCLEKPEKKFNAEKKQEVTLCLGKVD